MNFSLLEKIYIELYVYDLINYKGGRIKLT